MIIIVYSIIIEIALWLFIITTISILLPPAFSALSLPLLVFWRFRSSVFSFSSPHQTLPYRILRHWPYIFLLLSATVNKINIFETLKAYPLETTIAPFKEEMIYRLIIPRIIMVRFSAPSKSIKWVSTLISSVLFCYAHRTSFNNPLLDMPVCFISAIALGNRSQKNFISIFETLAIHALHNMHVVNNELRMIPPISAYANPVAFYGSLLVTDIWLEK